MENLEQLDGLFMTALQKSEGINNFFDNAFGFLFRKSDFFSNQESSRSIIDTSYKKFLTKFQEKQEKELKKQQQLEEERRKKEVNKTEKSQPSVKELTKEEFERARMEEELRARINANPELKKEIEKNNSVENKPTEKEEDKVAEGKIRPNKGNGANYEKYFWYQYTIQEITLIIPVDKKITGKDIKIKHDSKKLDITVGGEKIIYGELKHLMNSDSFLWVLEDSKDGKLITITFDKLDTWKWWECIIKGEQEIDTTKINPEPSKLSDLDGDMRGQVEKMMFDTRQKQMGLPSSDELKKQEMLKKFMDAHPEMDFSKAKFG